MYTVLAIKLGSRLPMYTVWYIPTTHVNLMSAYYVGSHNNSLHHTHISHIETYPCRSNDFNKTYMVIRDNNTALRKTDSAPKHCDCQMRVKRCYVFLSICDKKAHVEFVPQYIARVPILALKQNQEGG